jgi:hypothetical protein
MKNEIKFVHRKIGHATTMGRAIEATTGLILLLNGDVFGHQTRFDGHAWLLKKNKTTDLLFDKPVAMALAALRLHEYTEACTMFGKIDAACWLKTRQMVPFGTDLCDAARMEESGEQTLPTKVVLLYEYLFKRSGISALGREEKYQVFLVLRDYVASCVPAAILGQELGLGSIVLGRLGFKDPSVDDVYDWEYGALGARWV